MDRKYTMIFHSKALQKYTQIGIFGMKIYHLATLMQWPGPINDHEQVTDPN
jgi:hypothetical protein